MEVDNLDIFFILISFGVITRIAANIGFSHIYIILVAVVDESIDLQHWPATSKFHQNWSNRLTVKK